MSIECFRNMKFALLGAAAAVTLAASADDVYCVVDSYTKNPNDADYWDNNAVPTAENNYFVIGKNVAICTSANNATDVVFKGGLLTIGGEAGSGIFRPVGKNNTSSFPNGIRIYNGGNSTVNMGASGSKDAPDMNTYTHKIYGNIEILSTYKETAPQITFQYRSNGQHLYFMGKITGTADTGINFYGGEWSNVNTNNFTFFTGDLSDFYGTLEVVSGGDHSISTHSLALGTVTMPGTVNLSGGNNAYFRTATMSDTATVGTLIMSNLSALRPQVNPVTGTCGKIKVTDSFTQTGTQYLWVDCQDAFNSLNHKAFSIPVLTVPATSAANLKTANFELYVTGAGEDVNVAENFSMRVANDEDGLPTLYLDVAKYGDPEMQTPTMIVSDDANESAFLEAYASHWSTGEKPESGNTYLVYGKTLRTPYLPAAGGSNTAPLGETQTFGGDALVLGNDKSAGVLDLWSWAKVEIPKLIITNGCVQSRTDWTGLRGCVLDSEIEIAATDASKALFCTEVSWQHLYLAGSIKGAANSQMMIRNIYANCDSHVWSDMSQYYGTLILQSKTASHVANMTIGCAAIGGTLKLGETTAAGSGTLKISCTNSLTVKSLVVNRPTTLVTQFDGGTFVSGYGVITVSDSLTLNDGVTILPTVTGGDVIIRTDNLEAAFVPVIRWPKTCAVDETKIKLGDFTGLDRTPAEFFNLEVRDDGDYRVAGIAKRKVVILLNSDDAQTNSTLKAYTARCSFDQKYTTDDNQGRADGWNWSINERPRYEYDYYVNAKTLRTNSSVDEEYFQGHALYLYGTLILQSKVTTISNLYMIGNANLTHSHSVNKAVEGFDFAPGGARKVFGNITVTKKGGLVSAPACFAKSNCLYLGCDFKGSGELRCKVNTITGTSNNTPTFVWFAGENDSFTGKLTTLYDQNLANSVERLFMIFNDSDSLGGEPPALGYDIITLTDWTTLWVRETKTFSREKRGVFVKQSAGMRVDENATFTFDAPLAFRGRLYKDGAGTVFFKQTPTFLTADTKGVAGDPVEGSNVVSVLQGFVGVAGNPQALDGTKIVVSADAGLCVKVGDSATATLGLVNTKTDEPFALEGNNAVINVVFDLTDMPDPTDSAMGVCTVTEDADTALDLQNRLVLRRPKVCTARLIRTPDTDAKTVTYTAKFERRGMVVVIR